ncbi:hypothetical protein [Bacillus methanolicus]|uniref:Uncharacterized protein n=1 Tax=Bacillus methanolicus (strain MGA3 / ATCC 53907) TaxID=796606 RepID=A0A068LNT6_BACMM|nr:hypothetical protein [Bacillus methanolicus]AIE59426.1 hypothetical protein BMMGA3_04970 [Bacillus methanolicus MGA3]UQD53754.1 hypothetical protein C0971_05290 [Bacillus methanolicus]
MKRITRLEAVLWNIALPGFSQLLYGRFLKGLLFVVLEFIINFFSNFNLAIMYSFQWEIQKAFEVTNFQWLMFYPCLYMFAMWDAYKAASQKEEKFSYLPFVFSAYFVTVGLMYSPKFELFGVLLGPVFTPMMFLIPGISIGFLIKFLLLKHDKQKQ